MDQEKGSTAGVDKLNEDCLRAAALMLSIAGKASEEGVPQHTREKMRKINKLVNGMEKELFKTGTEMTPTGSSQLPPEGDRQTSTADDSQREKIQVKESNSSLPLQGSQ